jgi:NitT/TauT family transport system substrate-binding protein
MGILINPCNAQVRSAPEKVRVVYSAIGASQSTLWVPHEAGIFRKNGVEVELLYVGGGSRASQVLVSGDVAVGVFSGATVVSANLAGGDLAIIAAGTDVLPFILVAHPDVKRVEELRGKKIGITRFGSTTDFALRFVANKWGLRPESDFAVLQLGGQPEMMAGLTSGGVQAAMLNAEFAILAKRDGYRQLVDVASLGLPFPTGTLNTSRAYIRKNEDVVRRLVRGYVEGIHFAKNRRDFSVSVLSKYLKNQDLAYLNAVYDMYIQQFIPKIPNPSLDAVRTVLKQLGEKDQKARTASPQQFVEPRFMLELEKEGFVQQLWK